MKLRDALRLPERGRERARDNGHAAPLDETRLPVDPATGDPIPPRAQPGYYPGFSTLDQHAFWDEATRRVVLDRVHQVPSLHFFAAAEAVTLQAVVDRVLPQDDRDEAHRIPILNYIDDRLSHNVTDGYRFENMPPDGEAYRLGIQAIITIARHLYGAPFEQLHATQQDRVLQALHDGEPPAADEIWRQMSVKHFWLMLVNDCVAAYYAHPYAWDEIGFGGPAYPRGYMRLEGGKPEPWEVHERRYAWAPPPTSLSGEYTNLDHQTPMEQQFGEGGRGGGTPGQEGSH